MPLSMPKMGSHDDLAELREPGPVVSDGPAQKRLREWMASNAARVYVERKRRSATELNRVMGERFKGAMAVRKATAKTRRTRTGHTNIYKQGGRFYVNVAINGKPKYIGLYPTLTAAIDARDAAVAEREAMKEALKNHQGT